MQQTRITIINKLGLHARAASRLASLASQFDSDITIQKVDRAVNAKSIMEVMMLAAAKGSEVEISAQGCDENDAVNALTSLINDKFGEEE